jgi:hypothetical protein
MAALSTYMGHVNIYATYWYLEATADLMRDVADLEFSVQTRIAFFPFQIYWTSPITSGGSLMRKLTP